MLIYRSQLIYNLKYIWYGQLCFSLANPKQNTKLDHFLLRFPPEFFTIFFCILPFLLHRKSFPTSASLLFMSHSEKKNFSLYVLNIWTMLSHWLFFLYLFPPNSSIFSVCLVFSFLHTACILLVFFMLKTWLLTDLPVSLMSRTTYAARSSPTQSFLIIFHVLVVKRFHQ